MCWLDRTIGRSDEQKLQSRETLFDYGVGFDESCMDGVNGVGGADGGGNGSQELWFVYLNIADTKPGYVSAVRNSLPREMRELSDQQLRFGRGCPVHELTGQLTDRVSTVNTELYSREIGYVAVTSTHAKAPKPDESRAICSAPNQPSHKQKVIEYKFCGHEYTTTNDAGMYDL